MDLELLGTLKSKRFQVFLLIRFERIKKDVTITKLATRLDTKVDNLKTAFKEQRVEAIEPLESNEHSKQSQGFGQ